MTTPPIAPRIAIAGFLHETNTFAPTKAGMEAFLHGGGWPALATGEALVEAVRDTNVGAFGFIEEARGRGWRLAPLLWCAASPSAHVTRDAFERIAADLLQRLEAALPVEGVYLDLHGAVVAEHLPDGEGEILSRVRALVGPDVPVVSSLDLHGNVTGRMVEAADGLVAYRTYPHVDMADTGRRAANLMARLLTGQRFAKAFRQLPFLIPIAWQGTGFEPCRSLYALLEEMEGGDIASLSFLPGFPAADFADCGPSVVAYGATQDAADAAADRLGGAVADAETAFAGRAYEPLAAVREAMRLAEGASGPVVIADTQDNPGAGGNSDTTGMLRALVEAGAQNAAIGLIVDPEAARKAHEAGVGATVTLALGGLSAIAGDTPFEGTFTVEALSDGHLVALGPFYGGARHRLGPSASLRIGGVRVVLASNKTQMADREMFRFLGIEPESARILVVKSSVHFRADFEPIASAILVATAPGPMPLDPASLPFRHLREGVRLSPRAIAA
ncbi:M81 family metallopeptidase [Aureimonas populi]|uniref:Microcystinase C n=1 Tax=Aureimonas populi TaxID=1701758 RepID=A0ABW5CLX5_9HYPH|nr:M81 family metallopeptidase [Aureimonas populi]